MREKMYKEMLETFQKCLTLSRKKNDDYAASENPFKNFELIEKLTAGRVSTEDGILVRISDKIQRVANLLVKKNTVLDEKIEDSIDDAINYLAILKAFLKLRRKR